MNDKHWTLDAAVVADVKKQMGVLAAGSDLMPLGQDGYDYSTCPYLAVLTDRWGHALNEFESSHAALASWGKWLDSAAPAVHYAGPTEKVRVIIRRQVGNMEVELGIEREVFVNSGRERRLAMEHMNRAVLAEHVNWINQAASNAQTLAGSQVFGGTHTSTSGNMATFEGGVLSHEYADGKHRWRLKVGPYTKWGIPVYEEVLAQVGIDHTAGDLGEQDWPGSAEVLMGDKGPRKVTRLVRA